MKTARISNLIIPALAVSAILVGSQATPAEEVKVFCEVAGTINTIVAESEGRQITLLQFLPEYFASEQDARAACQQTAQTLQVSYNQEQVTYLTSGLFQEQPVVCAVSSRDSDCNSYDAQLLFQFKSEVEDPVLALYQMLGQDFQQPKDEVRTLTRIYTNISPRWWPWQ